VLFPWPWPANPATALAGLAPSLPWYMPEQWGHLPVGLYPWPAWEPVSDWLQPGSWTLGLITGLAGAICGMAMLRLVKFIFEVGLGKPALGLGDADLMMMAGAFLGWQPVVVAFFAGALVTLGFAVVQAVVFRDNSLPFGPGLAAGIVLTFLCWRWIGWRVQPLMYNVYLLGGCVVAGAAFMLVASALFRLRRGPEAPESA
jgi:leader peptidase (prepilin peptidase)/N-methyltransferase